MHGMMPQDQFVQQQQHSQRIEFFCLDLQKSPTDVGIVQLFHEKDYKNFQKTCRIIQNQ